MSERGRGGERGRGREKPIRQPLVTLASVCVCQQPTAFSSSSFLVEPGLSGSSSSVEGVGLSGSSAQPFWFFGSPDRQVTSTTQSSPFGRTILSSAHLKAYLEWSVASTARKMVRLAVGGRWSIILVRLFGVDVSEVV